MCGMDKPLTPLGELLESAREALRPKLSQNAVAKQAQTSPTTYRRVITGIARLGGRDVPFDGNAETIARIAQVLGVTPEQLEEAGRSDAAAELRLLGRHAEMEDAEADVRDAERHAVAAEGDDPKMQRALELLAEATAMLEEIRRKRREGA